MYYSFVAWLHLGTNTTIITLFTEILCLLKNMTQSSIEDGYHHNNSNHDKSKANGIKSNKLMFLLILLLHNETIDIIDCIRMS